LESAWKEILALSNFFSLVSSRAFRDAAHSRFWCGDSKVCLRGPLNMLNLALPQIYTRLLHLWKSVALENAWDRDSRPFIFFSIACFRAFSDAAHSRFCCWDPKLCLRGSLKMLVLALHQIYTNVFHLWKSIDLDNV